MNERIVHGYAVPRRDLKSQTHELVYVTRDRGGICLPRSSRSAVEARVLHDGRRVLVRFCDEVRRAWHRPGVEPVVVRIPLDDLLAELDEHHVVSRR